MGREFEFRLELVESRLFSEEKSKLEDELRMDLSNEDLILDLDEILEIFLLG